jgi:hypothetical protein
LHTPNHNPSRTCTLDIELILPNRPSAYQRLGPHRDHQQERTEGDQRYRLAARTTWPSRAADRGASGEHPPQAAVNADSPLSNPCHELQRGQCEKQNAWNNV